MSRAEIARELATVTGNQKKNTLDARKQCRQAISMLRTLGTELANLLKQTHKLKPSERDPTSWTVRELESLDRNLSVQLARGYRNQGLCYEEDSVDRINSLALALEQLQDVVPQPVNDSSVWQARLEQITCLRLLKKNVVAQKQVAHWLSSSPPESIASRLAGEQIRIALATGDLDRALQLVNDLQHADEATAPETDDAVLETLLAARSMSLPEKSEPLTRQALAQIQHIATQHGHYWKQRAELRFGAAQANQLDSDEPELLHYAAASLYVSGSHDRAVATYERIANLQAARGHAALQFEALETAAAIVRKSGSVSAALSRYRQLAIQHSRHDKAATMHMIAIGLAAETARNSNTADRGGHFEHYFKLLNEHLTHWPEEASAEQVRLWLARTELPSIEQQRIETLTATGDREQALELHRRLIKKNPHNPDQLEAYALLLATGDDLLELRAAQKIWQQIERRSKPGGPRWWRGRRARLELLQQLGEGVKAKQLQQLTEILYPDGVMTNSE